MEGPQEDQKPVDIHEPFTKAELIQQLAEIDRDITLLLTHSGTATRALAPPVDKTSAESLDPGYGTLRTTVANPENTIMDLNSDERLTTFRDSMNAFITTLHSVDVRLKRQIWALEEAGIISLKSTREPAAEGSGAAENGGTGQAAAATAAGGDDAGGAALKTGLGPDGVGKVGGLDVGWLNARSSKVERDMEAELWTEIREYFDGIFEGTIPQGEGLYGSYWRGARPAGEEGGGDGDANVEK